MNPNISFETALQLLTMAYVASVMLVLLASQIGLAVIETLEAADLINFYPTTRSFRKAPARRVL
jgi:hypothetical protein